MFAPEVYQLLDFGEARRLERFGPLVLDRPCPSTAGIARANVAAWDAAHSRFVRTGKDRGEWNGGGDLVERWTVSHGPLVFELKRTEFGHLGIFPEQAGNWDWFGRRLQGASQPIKVLNLFGYTGGSTLAAAAAGAEVTHVDAAQNVVAWARRNAELSGLSGASIRWVAEDAVKFVRRELKRGNRYDAVILDPPSYGHGPRGEVWRLSKHLPALLEMCAALTAGRTRFLLLTCHTPGFGPERLERMLRDALGESRTARITAAPLAIRAATGRELGCGVVARWERS